MLVARSPYLMLTGSDGSVDLFTYKATPLYDKASGEYCDAFDTLHCAIFFILPWC